MRFMPTVCIDVATKMRSSMDICLGVGGRDKQVILSRSEQEQDCVVCDPILAIQAHEPLLHLVQSPLHRNKPEHQPKERRRRLAQRTYEEDPDPRIGGCALR